MANGLQTWDGGTPLACRIEGDRLYAVPDEDRAKRGDWPRVDDLERERRLYLRLADLAVRQRDGSVTPRSGWQRKALEFANLYAPPVDYSSFHLFSQQGVSLSHFAAESLLLWWVLHLKAQLASPKPSLREALTAVAQIYWFFPVAKAGRVVTFYSSEWTKLLSSFVVQVTEETAAGERQAPPIPTKPMSREGGFPPTSYEVRGLPPKELAPIVDGLLESHEHDKGRLWQLAHNAFATVVNVRLTGVTLMCLPAGERPTAAPSVGFQFLTPLARIWYGLWEDVAGLRIRHCARAQCGRFFIPNRKDKRFCSPRCQNAEKVAGWRKAQAEKSRKASARKGKASKISSSSR